MHDKQITNLVDFLEVYGSYSNWYSKKRTENDEKTLHVYDLIFCTHKRVMQREHPELSNQISMKPAVMMGSLFHKGIETFIEEQTGRKPKDNVFSKKIKDYTIIGSFDLVLSNGQPIEVKTSWTTKSKEFWYFQMGLYAWLSGQKLKLWKFTPTHIVEEDVDVVFTDEDVLDLIETERIPFWDGSDENECVYCTYQKVCKKKSLKFGNVTVGGFNDKG